MRLFISWSGSVSRALAVEVRDWLPMVVQQVAPWISSRDIGPGQRWALVLGRELGEAAFAVLCITRENLTAPWILFEAGAVARSLEARVIPLLLGVRASALEGPLAQFQSVEADKDGVRTLVDALFDASQSKLEPHQRDLVFESLWPPFEKRLKSLATEVNGEVPGNPKDLAAEIMASSELMPRSITSAKDALKRLSDEKDRLKRELDYLVKEEEKLTAQDAPISLVEQAIEPTEHRLEELDLSIDKVLSNIVNQLAPPQLSLLRTLVTPSGLRRVWSYDSSADGGRDIRELEKIGLIVVDERGVSIVHDLVAEYIARRLGAT